MTRFAGARENLGAELLDFGQFCEDLAVGYRLRNEEQNYRYKLCNEASKVLKWMGHKVIPPLEEPAAGNDQEHPAGH